MDLLNKLFKTKEPSSRAIAKERLQLVLVHDRAQISPQLLQTIKDEIIDVISRYLEIEQDGVEITFTQNRRQSRLQADIPLMPNRRRQAAR
ncbi:MAG: cell division topological specificity factor MinE [Anaerolineae bacterium]|jgi:cell division topological specificity factor|nr:cell division topological specificity factor MinE [Anaerolineae bacterium]